MQQLETCDYPLQWLSQTCYQIAVSFSAILAATPEKKNAVVNKVRLHRIRSIQQKASGNISCYFVLISIRKSSESVIILYKMLTVITLTLLLSSSILYQWHHS